MKYLLGIMALSIMDTFNTLYILENGGTEVNPVMEWFLGYGDWAFILGKNIITLSCLFIINKYIGLTRFNKYATLNILLFIYIILIIYQYYLIILIKGI